MAITSTPTIHETGTIKIIKVKGKELMWYAIYADDVEICTVFAKHPDTHLPNIMMLSEEETSNVHPLYTERTPETGALYMPTELHFTVAEKDT